MAVEKLNADWKRMTFSYDSETPEELRIDMFVRVQDQDKGLYSVGWVHEFKDEGECQFKSMSQVSEEAGIDFSALGLNAEMPSTYILDGMTERDLIWLKSISRLWAVKKSINHQLSDQYALEDMIRDREDHLIDDVMHKTDKAFEEKVRKLEKMTFKLLKQNITIYKTLKGVREKPKGLLGRIFK